jgi:hypothetical protein
MKRSSFSRIAPDADRLSVLVARKPKTRKCKVCPTRFIVRNSMCDKWCSPECGAILGMKLAAEKKAKAERAERALTRAQKEALKDINDLKAEAQTAFNAFIRERDKHLPCICCGRLAPKNESLTGGGWDAAHYRSRGSADHLRYDETNVHRALKYCNTHGHHDYRGGLIARIGLEAVEALEANQTIVKWTKDGLRAIRTKYRQKLKDLQKEASSC